MIRFIQIVIPLTLSALIRFFFSAVSHQKARSIACVVASTEHRQRHAYLLSTSLRLLADDGCFLHSLHTARGICSTHRPSTAHLAVVPSLGVAPVKQMIYLSRDALSATTDLAGQPSQTASAFSHHTPKPNKATRLRSFTIHYALQKVYMHIGGCRCRCRRPTDTCTVRVQSTCTISSFVFASHTAVSKQEATSSRPRKNALVRGFVDAAEKERLPDDRNVRSVRIDADRTRSLR